MVSVVEFYVSIWKNNFVFALNDHQSHSVKLCKIVQNAFLYCSTHFSFYSNGNNSVCRFVNASPDREM
jgi:hypothetical protein